MTAQNTTSQTANETIAVCASTRFRRRAEEMSVYANEALQPMGSYDKWVSAEVGVTDIAQFVEELGKLTKKLQVGIFAVADELAEAHYSKNAAKDPTLLSLRVRAGADAAREGACIGSVS